MTLGYRGLLLYQGHGQSVLLLIIPRISSHILVLLLFNKHSLKWGELFLGHPGRPGQWRVSLSGGLRHVALLFKGVIFEGCLIQAALGEASESLLCLTGPIPRKSDSVTAYPLEVCMVVNFVIFF